MCVRERRGSCVFLRELDRESKIKWVQSLSTRETTIYYWCTGSSQNKTGLPQCQDLDTSGNCGVWASQGECVVNSDYMLVYCKRSCSVCTGSSTAPPPPACQDLDTSGNCAAWARQGECTRNPNYMLSHCKLSCQVCGPVSSRLSACQDQDTSGNCATWAQLGECTSNPRYMRLYCARSCNACTG